MSSTKPSLHYVARISFPVALLLSSYGGPNEDGYAFDTSP